MTATQAASARKMALPAHRIALLRLVAQRIAGPALPTPAAAVRWLTAMQAQDLRGALSSVAVRTTGGRKQVEAALNTGEIVRSWPMRGTLHLVAAEDLTWLLDLLAPRVIASRARRYAELGLDQEAFDRARRAAESALAGGAALTRAELLAVFARAGVDPGGQRGYHLIGQLAQTGTLCLGPMRDGSQLFVLTAEWVRNPRRLEREAALAELATRFFRSHGPATLKDFIRWTNLTAADARAGLSLARPQLDRMEVDGVEMLLDPATPELLRAAGRRARGVFLLPGFDELVLGYADRSVVLPPAYADRVVPGGNGIFQPTVVSDGRIVGTWRYAGRGTEEVTATPFEAFPDRVAREIPKLAAALEG